MYSKSAGGEHVMATLWTLGGQTGDRGCDNTESRKRDKRGSRKTGETMTENDREVEEQGSAER